MYRVAKASSSSLAAARAREGELNPAEVAMAREVGNSTLADP
jgi:hypothetical protein